MGSLVDNTLPSFMTMVFIRLRTLGFVQLIYPLYLQVSQDGQSEIVARGKYSPQTFFIRSLLSRHFHIHGEDFAGGDVGEVVGLAPVVEVHRAELYHGGAAVLGGCHLAGLILGDGAAFAANTEDPPFASATATGAADGEIDLDALSAFRVAFHVGLGGAQVFEDGFLDEQAVHGVECLLVAAAVGESAGQELVAVACHADALGQCDWVCCHSSNVLALYFIVDFDGKNTKNISYI